jgi:putative hydrolase of the HAD superfamily
VTHARIEAVTFDYWNTIIRADASQGASRRQAWAREYFAAGHVVEDDGLQEVFRAVWDEHQAAWLRNEQYSGERAARAAVDLVGLPVGPEVRERLVERFLTAGEALSFHLCEGVDAALAELRGRGVRLGIVCDVGFTPSTGLRRILERFGLLDCFDGWSFSDEVGWYKPARPIFEHALGYLGMPPQAVAHVGDLRRTDVAGAKGMGMTAVRYRGAHDDVSEGPEADHVIDHHALLLPALSL